MRTSTLLCVTRTTLAIDDEILKKMKEKAAREERTLQDVANELLRHALFHQRSRKTIKRLRVSSSGDSSARFLTACSAVMLAQTERHAARMIEMIRDSGVNGNLVHDAHVAALCIEHGVSELITSDRDFSRFPLKTANPFE